MKKSIYFVLALLIFTALACSFNASTANIKDAKMAKDAEGTQPTTTFAQDEPFYAVVVLANAPSDTKVKAVWTAVEIEGESPNTKIDEVETTSGDGQIHFDLTNNNNMLWPVGKYKVELYLNDKLDRALDFAVEASAAAQAPTPTEEPTATPTQEPTATPTQEPTATPTEEPTATPKPKPTATPKPEPTEEATAEPTEEVSVESTEEASTAGDSLAGVQPTEEATQAEVLPFKDEAYTHPTGAFTFAVPENFKEVASDDTSASFGDDNSVVGAAFTNPGVVFTNKEMDKFIDGFMERFMGTFASDYKILERKTLDDDSIFVAVQFDSTDGQKGDADFIFEQRDTAAFVLYLVTLTYDEIQPTWSEIIGSYSVDPEAAVAASPAETPEATAEPEPTKKPAEPTPVPQPTEPPTPAGPEIPAGKGMLIMLNCRGDVINVDVIPAGVFQELAPKTGADCQPGAPITLDPGNYTLKASIAGQPSSGESTVTITPGQVLEFTWY
jgi:hypothetical protein